MGKPKSLAEQVSAAQMMLIGLKANQAALEKRGVTEVFVTAFETLLTDLIAANGKQETLKAETKAATAVVDGLQEQVAKVYSEAVTMVKLEQPVESWQAFGITAKR
jgi:hypothetical protein